MKSAKWEGVFEDNIFDDNILEDLFIESEIETGQKVVIILKEV